MRELIRRCPSRRPRVARLVVAVACSLPAPALPADTLRVPEDYPTIQAAIDVAMDGDEILVGPGTYRERIQIPTRVTITGRDGAIDTILDAEGIGEAVVMTAPDGILRGLTIRNGFSTQEFSAAGLNAQTRCALYDCRFETNTGSLIVEVQDANGMIIDGCDFIGNTATYTVLEVPTSGTGVVFVTQSTFKENQAQTLLSSGEAELRALDCSFTGNVVSGWCVGGGYDSFFSDSRVERSLFADNEGGLVNLGGQDNFASVRQCMFLRNRCGNRVAIPFPFQAFGAVSNCVFVGNTSAGEPLITADPDDIADFFVDDSLFFMNETLPIRFSDAVAGIHDTIFLRNRVLDGPASILGGSDGIQQDVALSGCVFWGNDSPGDIEIRLSGNNQIDDFYINNNYIEGGRGAVEVTGGWNLFWGENNERLIPSPAGAVAVTLGTHLSGGLPEILESDDLYLRVRSRFGFAAGAVNVVDLHASTTAPETTDELVHILFAAETRLNQTNGTETFRVRNWGTGGFDVHHSRAPATEDFIFISQPIDAGPYVRASDRRVELSIRQTAVATFNTIGFISATDLIAFAVTVPEP